MTTEMTFEMQELMSTLKPYMVTDWRVKLCAPGFPNGILEGMCRFTPDLCRTLLDTRNPRNRALHPRKVSKLRNAMREGRWNPSLPDSTAVFGKDGNIKNGQHRLAASRDEEVAFVSRIEMGHDNEILIHLDQTEPRTEIQQAKILGRDSGEKYDYAAAKFLWQLQNQKTYFPFERGAKTFDLIDRDYPREIWDIVPVKVIGEIRLVYPIRAALLLLAITWPNEVREFVRQLREIQFTPKSGPHLLFTYMTASKSFPTEKQTYEGKMTMVRRTFKAFHLFLEGKTVTKLLDPHDSVQKLFRQVDPNWAPVTGGPFDPNRKRAVKDVEALEDAVDSPDET